MKAKDLWWMSCQFFIKIGSVLLSLPFSSGSSTAPRALVLILSLFAFSRTVCSLQNFVLNLLNEILKLKYYPNYWSCATLIFFLYQVQYLNSFILSGCLSTSSSLCFWEFFLSIDFFHCIWSGHGREYPPSWSNLLFQAQRHVRFQLQTLRALAIWISPLSLFSKVPETSIH